MRKMKSGRRAGWKAVGQFYEEFSQLSGHDVFALLRQAAETVAHG
jgi:predicted phosphoribosyltransferase